MLTPLRPLFLTMEHQRGESGLQLLLLPTTALREATFPAPRPPPPIPSHHPQLDLSLSISIGPPQHQTEEQARLASAERAYAARVTELARRELELAEREFARARAIWDRARGEVEKVERVKAAARGSAAALEITCHACMQRFHP
ncbi:hypothetical protein ACP4OV_006533 [Aristida adscensionis]